MTSARRGGNGLYARGGKRGIDLVAAASVGILSIPLQLAIAALVRVKLGRPVLFRQERPGINGQPFVLVKFRTMTSGRNPDGELLPESLRLTRFGQFLRQTSLDELPELWNVLKGDMSLVGPRPLLMEYLPLYTTDQARRHGVRPGMTGWAQVNGRNSAGWLDKFAMDTWYVDNVSIGLDLKVLGMTVAAVFSQQGVSAEGHVTAPKFTGTEGSEAS